MTSQRLKQAYELIKANKKQEAVDILRPVLKFDDKNADAWWLMANALENPDEIRDALENVLRLRPTSDKARNMLDKLDLRYPPLVQEKDVAFTFEDAQGDDQFEVVDAPDNYPVRGYDKGDAIPLGEDGKVIVTKSKRKTSPWVIILAVIGGLVGLSCIVCLGLSTAGISIFSQALSDPTLQAVLQQMPEVITTVAAISDNKQTLPTDVRMRGTVEPGQTVHGTIDTFDDGWIFSGSQGRQTTIELTGSGDLDTQLYVYNADRQLIEENDDIDFGNNHDSRIEFSLPYSGNYTIVVSAFGTGGNYELTLR